LSKGLICGRFLLPDTLAGIGLCTIARRGGWRWSNFVQYLTEVSNLLVLLSFSL
jgi:hypothetical protein